MKWFRRKRSYMAFNIVSGNAIGITIESEEEALDWLEKLAKEEPEALEEVGVLEFDHKGHPIRALTLNPDSKES